MELLENKQFQAQLQEMGFTSIGSGWFESEDGDVRLRLWKHCEIAFWLWRSSVNEEDNEIRFKGIIHNIEEVKWVLKRCFSDQGY